MPLQRGASQVSAVLFGATLRILLIRQDKEDNVGIWIGFAELPTCSLFSPVGGLEYHGRIRIVKPSALYYSTCNPRFLSSCVRVPRRTPRSRLALPQR